MKAAYVPRPVIISVRDVILHALPLCGNPSRLLVSGYPVHVQLPELTLRPLREVRIRHSPRMGHRDGATHDPGGKAAERYIAPGVFSFFDPGILLPEQGVVVILRRFYGVLLSGRGVRVGEAEIYRNCYAYSVPCTSSY